MIHDRLPTVDTQIFGIVAAILTQLLQSLGLTIQRKAHLKFQAVQLQEDPPEAENLNRANGAKTFRPVTRTGLYSSSPREGQWSKLTRPLRRILRLPTRPIPSPSIYTAAEEEMRIQKPKRLVASPLWIFGFIMYLAAGLIGTPFQLSALPILILAPLGSISLVTNAIFATTVLGDPFTRTMLLGTVLVFAGTIVVAIFGRVPEQNWTLDHLMQRYSDGGVLGFLISLILILIVFLTILHNAERHPDWPSKSSKSFHRFVRALGQRVNGLRQYIVSASQRKGGARSFFDADAQPLLGDFDNAPNPKVSNGHRTRLRRPSLMTMADEDDKADTVTPLSPLTSPTLPGPLWSFAPFDYGAIDRSERQRVDIHHHRHRRSRSSVSSQHQASARQYRYSHPGFSGGSGPSQTRHQSASPSAGSSGPSSPFSSRGEARAHVLTPSIPPSIREEPNGLSSLTRYRLILGGAFAVVSGTLSGLVLLFAKTGVEVIIYIFEGGKDGKMSTLEAALHVFGRWETWMVIAGLLGPGLTQLIYLSHSLRLASPTLVCPISFIAYTLASISSSLIYSGQSDAISAPSWLAVIGGLILTGAGVWVISGTASQVVQQEVEIDEEVFDEERSSEEFRP